MRTLASASLLLAALSFALSAIAKTVDPFDLQWNGGNQWGAPPPQDVKYTCYPTNTSEDYEMTNVPASTTAINSSITFFNAQPQLPVANTLQDNELDPAMPKGTCAAAYSTAEGTGFNQTGVRVYVCGPNNVRVTGADVASSLQTFLNNCPGPATLQNSPPVRPMVRARMKGPTQVNYTGGSGVVWAVNSTIPVWLFVQADHGQKYFYPKPA